MFVKIDSLKIQNFRNYDEVQVKFDDKVNVFIGKNAQGKTNLLESIFYCCIGKSFKPCKDKEIIKWGKEFASIHMIVQRKFRDVKIDVRLDKEEKHKHKLSSNQKNGRFDWRSQHCFLFTART